MTRCGPTSGSRSSAELATIWEREWGHLLGPLVRRFGDLDTAEDALADAFEAAARVWPADGIPDNPAGWLATTARRRALDHARAAAIARRKLPLLIAAESAADPTPDQASKRVIDDELRLILLCCHPALSQASRAALALRLALGISTADIASLFGVDQSAMAARITRSKKKIVRAGLPFALPAGPQLSERVAVAADVAYLCFTAGYAPSSGDRVVRVELAGEAIRLARALIRLLPGPQPGLIALLALMLLQHSRRAARVDQAENLVLLADQDRERWNSDEIAEGTSLLDSLSPMTGRAEELRLQARIAARHATARSWLATDWLGIADDYAQLDRLTNSPIVRLNRAVAVAEAVGPRAGLELLNGLEQALPQSHRLPAVTAELLTRAGDLTAARVAYQHAIDHCRHAPELRFLRERLARLDSLRSG